jgi:hypothetical protein
MIRSKFTWFFRGRLRLAAFAAVMAGVAGIVYAQTIPGTAVSSDPFEVHGLLYSGSAPGGFALGDAWAQGTSHYGVLDDNGQPASDADGAPFNASRMVDPNWGNMGDGFDGTLFDGRNKNGDSIGVSDAPWAWAGGGGSPQKNDITNAYFHTRVDPATGDRWVFVAAETRSINGDSHVDFEFNQAGLAVLGETEGEIVGLGPDGGRTIDDFMISVDFEQGGEHPVAIIRAWDGVEFVEVSKPGAVFSATNVDDIPHGANGTWKHFTADGAETSVLTHLQLVEGAANLTALGIQVNPCSTDATFIAKTRSSSSWTADLKDFAVVRFPLEPMPELKITNPQEVCTGATFDVSVEDMTGLPNTTLLWSLEGCGQIIGDATAAAISVQADLACGCDIVLSVAAEGGMCRHEVIAQATIAVGDDSLPALSDEPDDVTAECDGIPAATVVTATDDCMSPQVEFVEDTAAGTCLGDSVITRTWSAADDCENTASHTQTVTVQDTTAPVLAGVPADQWAACDDIPEAAVVTASDNCSDAPVEFAEATTPGACTGEALITRTWTATDACGNEVSEPQLIMVYDDVAPVMSGVPADAAYECNALPDPAEVTATDNCSDVALGLDEDATPGACDGESTVTRTWTADDDCGNRATEQQVITLVDTTNPVLVGVPADVTVECDSIPEPPQVTATDNCGEPVVEYIEDVAAGPGAGKALITRTWTATDDCGNQTSATQRITVIDTTAPTLIGVPADATYECDSLPAPPEVTAEDNCAVPTVAFNETTEPGPCEGTLIVTRTWTATDDCGNQTSQTQVITLVDTTAPVFDELPADLTAECDAIPDAPAVTATDNCSTARVDLDEVEEPGDCAGGSLVTRTWTATDACGNQSTHVQLVTVVDTTDPVLSGEPADEVAECDDVPGPVTLTATDNCDPDVPVTRGDEQTPGICAGDYTVLRTWLALDDCGNEAGVDQLLTVEDTTAPQVHFSPNRTQFICDGRPVEYRATASDNCVDAALTVVDVMGITMNSRDRVTVTESPDGTVRITATGPAIIRGTLLATDDCGNDSLPFEVDVRTLLGLEACSQGFWRNHPERWSSTGYSPAMRFVGAFEITDLSSPEIPSSFSPSLTLLEAANMTGGSFDQTLLQGTAALLNAAYPSMDYPLTVEQVLATMQAAFAGDISFDEAHGFFTTAQAAEGECGCPVD